MILNGKTVSKELLARYIGYLLLIIPLIPIEGLYYLNRSVYNLVFTYLTAIDALAIIGYWMMYLFKSKKKLGYAALILMMLAVYNIVMTIGRHGDIRGAIGVWLYTIPVILLAEINRNKLGDFLKIVLFYLEFLILVNFLLTLIYPNGMYSVDTSRYGKMWILGYKSSLQCYVFPAVVISLLFSAYGRHYKNTIFLLLISHAVCISESNGMLLAGLAMIDLIVITKLYQKKFISRKALIIIVAVIAVANIIVVFFTSSFLSSSAVQYIIYSLLGKNATFSLRTSNWRAVLPAIKANPIWGYGYTWESSRAILYGRETAHAHNLFLELLYESGAIGFILFVILNIVILRRLYKHFKKTSSRVIFYALVVFYLMYIFENVFQKSSSFIWLLFITGYYTNFVDAELNNAVPAVARKSRRIGIMNNGIINQK